ncbi:VOC family protein [Amycolatopsis thermophila]|uniref:3,4-dihydroxy-9,10-secoandrosta-1,3, 5(10)-triene-9,17-dione 4,5-dioxygenase n=1 Tax=Amycolatopsis thermophila TaxID=206084 RepID=A0ABU0ERY5_9PSEU|nr:VOC family protein [Amycolatopsis thermophila]MDQ0377873.1 3,4-dihydroxy-9,10-secoandrosta-1,3,5(10)-triene-9,17-dione 4,5-dioxygenase [Amycolatopsis thermophila]
MTATALGYVGINAEAPQEWAGYAELFGLRPEQDVSGAVRLRADERSQRIIVEAGQSGLGYLGWEVPTPAALEATANRLDDAGVRLREGTPAELDLRRVDRLLWCADPSGNRVEFATPVARSDREFEPAAGVSGFVTGELGVGHVALCVTDLDASLRFYRDVMGLRISEQMPGIGAAFLRAGGRHHSLVLFDVGITGIDHLFVQAESIHDLGRAMDSARQKGVNQSVALGYHPPDGTISAYFASPSRFRLEYGWGGRTVDDTWIPGSCDETPWGHDGLLDSIHDALAAGGRLGSPTVGTNR